MGVKIGNSYVSESAFEYAKNQVDEKSKSKSENVLNSLKKQFKETKFSIGTQPFNSSGTNNISISPNILREMANDPDKKIAKQKEIAEKLKSANEYLKSREGEIGFQGGSVSIDKDGNITITSAKSTVTFNESKRAAQLAAVKTVDDLQKLMALLKDDLDECKSGLQNNMCDEEEVKKVERMIERAQSRMNELNSNKSDEKNFSSVDFLI